MSRVLPGTASQVTAQVRADLIPASAWIEAHYGAFRGQWVAVHLEEPALVASAPTLCQLWQTASPAQLKDCLLQYVYTVEEEHQARGPWWEG
jgi:hypothetical protein